MKSPVHHLSSIKLRRLRGASIGPLLCRKTPVSGTANVTRYRFEEFRFDETSERGGQRGDQVGSSGAIKSTLEDGVFGMGGGVLSLVLGGERGLAYKTKI